MSDKERTRRIQGVTLRGFVVNVVLVVAKLVAGLVGHSSALVADSMHSLADVLSDVIVLTFVHLGARPKDNSHNYGHGKFETLATLFVALLLLFIALGICCDGVAQIIAAAHGNHPERPAVLVLVIALIAIALKEWIYHYMANAGRKLRSDVLIANAWHHRSDAMASTCIFVGIAGARILGDSWTVLDPIAAALMGLVIMRMAWKLLRNATDVLVERCLPKEVQDEIRHIAMRNAAVKGVESLNTRNLGDSYAIELVVDVPAGMTVAAASEAAASIAHELTERFGKRTHVIVSFAAK